MLFLSYSRQQLYFAESLTQFLQLAGHTVWFDLQQLKPGIDWQRGIQTGLGNSDGVVLVASRASLASPYVQLEWKHALQHNKPVYVVVFEDCVLPPELEAAATAVIDFRRDFDARFRQLNACIAGETTCPRYPIPAPNRFNFPTVLEPEVRRIAIFLALISVAVVVFGVLIAVFGVTSTVAREKAIWIRNGGFTSLAGVGLVFVTIRFLYRQIGYRSLQTLWTIFLVLTMFGLVVSGIIVVVRISLGEFSLAGVVAFAVFCVIFSYGHRANNESGVKSMAVLRWMPKGVVGLEQREQYNRIRGSVFPRTSQQQQIFPQGRRLRYKIHHHPFDRSLARFVEDTMARSGHVRAPDGPADAHIVLITRFTDYAAHAQPAIDADGDVIPVVVANVMQREQFKPLLQYQTVDFRKRNRDTLQRMAAYLANPGAATSYGVSVTPERFDKKLYPSLGNRLGSAIALIPFHRVPKVVYEGAVLVGFGVLLVNVVVDEINNPTPPPQPTATPAPTLDFFETSATQGALVDSVLGNLSGEVTMRDVSITLPQFWTFETETNAVNTYFGDAIEALGHALSPGNTTVVTVMTYTGQGDIAGYLSEKQATPIPVPQALQDTTSAAYIIDTNANIEAKGWVFVMEQTERTLLVHVQTLSARLSVDAFDPLLPPVMDVVASIE